MKKTIYLLVLVFFVSCEKDLFEAEMLGENADIIGTWVDNGYVDDVTLMERSDKLDITRYGFTIAEEGTFTEHKNAGWCGTPPITYDSFDGQWTALSDSLLEITVGYWGSTLTYQMRIVFLDQENLGIRYLYAEDRALSR